MRMRNHNTSDRALVLGINPKCMDMHRIWGKTRRTTPLNYTTLGGGLHTEPSTAVSGRAGIRSQVARFSTSLLRDSTRPAGGPARVEFHLIRPHICLRRRHARPPVRLVEEGLKRMHRDAKVR